jgi:FKBP-type peptidyl-prolyl cis-trans isomerase
LKSGLRYRDVDANNGTSTPTTSTTSAVQKEVASDGDKVSIHYTGYLPSYSMNVFDSSLPRGKPISFTLGDKQVIAGWEEGILGMTEGGRRHLLIPPHLGYGYNEVGSIPSGSTLLFDCELLKIEKKRSFGEKIKAFVFNNIFKYG